MADDQAIAARMAAARESAKHLKERADTVAAANPFYKGKDINKVSSNCYDQDGKRLLPRPAAKTSGSAKTRKTPAAGRVAAPASAPAPALVPGSTQAPASTPQVATFDAGCAAATGSSFPSAAPGSSPASPVSGGWQSAAAYPLSAPPTPSASAASFVPSASPAPLAPAAGAPLWFTHRTPTVLEAIAMGLHPFQMYPLETFDPPLWARADPRGPPTGCRQPTFLEACQLGLHIYQASIPVWYGWRPSTTDEAVLEERRRGIW